MLLVVSIEKVDCLSTVPNIFTLSTIFPLSWGKRQLKTAEVSWGCCLLFGHVLLFFCPVQLHQAMPTPQKPGLMKTLEMEDVHSSESCTAPCSGSQCSLFQGWLKAGQLSCHFHWCFRQTLQRAFSRCGIPTLYSFPNPSRPGLSLHIKCSLQILPSQKITHLKLSVAFIWCSHYNSLTLHLYEFPIYLLPEEMYCTTAFLRLLLMVLIS